jgi:type II secretory pathway component GspD/PulD (secretin)
MIRLSLKPKFSIETGTVNVGGTSATYPQPVVDRREADTTLLIKNGQTVVLGGLRKRDVSQQTNKIPLLSDLPLVGGLFKFEGESMVTSELVVFITPRIMESAILSPAEKKAYEVTEFKSPEPVVTKAEAEENEKK